MRARRKAATAVDRRRLIAAGCAALGLGMVSDAVGHGAAAHGGALVEFEPPVPAPEFSLPDPSGRQMSLEGLRGRYVLVNFWATWCPPCVEELPSMQVLHDGFEADGFAVVAISIDEEPADVLPFVERLAIRFPVLLDPRQQVANRFGVKALPASFLLDRAGRVIAAAKGQRDWASEELTSYIGERVKP